MPDDHRRWLYLRGPMNLNERINRALARAKKPGPEAIARRVMAEMSTEERDAALATCLVDRVRIQITRARLGDQNQSDSQLPRVAGPRTEGPSKWKALIPPQVYVPEIGWKFEIELTVSDLRAVAAEYAGRAAQMTAKQRQYKARADQLEVSGFATWGEYVAAKEQAA